MRNLLLLPAHGFFFVIGVIRFLLWGKNSYRAHRALVYFFCRTGGRFNDLCSRMISLFHKPLAQDTNYGILADLEVYNGKVALQELKDKGFVVFENALTQETCQKLLDFAMRTPANIRPMDGEPKPSIPYVELYNAEKPKAVRYDYKLEDLLANEEVQNIIADNSLLALAESYLEARPRLDVLGMWWHTNFHAKGDSEAAQFYHFDLDRFKWLKIFIYLTDVGPNDGPHSFISGSHRSGAIPQLFLDRGYVRLMDDEVLAHYGEKREVKFASPRGTVIIEDTRGLHKGSPVSGNPRLLLQIQLSNSLFGANYSKAVLPSHKTPGFAAQLERFADVYKAYL